MSNLDDEITKEIEQVGVPVSKEDLDSLEVEKLRDFKKILQKQIAKKTKESKRSIPPEIEAELKPYEDDLIAAEKKFLENEKNLKSRYHEMVENYKQHRENNRMIFETVKKRYQEKKEQLGIRSTRSKPVGKNIEWHVRIVDKENKIVEVGVKDKPSTYVEIQAKRVNGKGKYSVSTAILKRDIIEPNKIQDPRNGRVHGLYSKIQSILNG